MQDDPTREPAARIIDDGYASMAAMFRRAALVMSVMAIALPAAILSRPPREWGAAALVFAWFGALVALSLYARRGLAARIARVREAVLDHPEDVAEIAHHRTRGTKATVTIILRDGAKTLLRVDDAERSRIVAALAARCTAAVVHDGYPSKRLRNGPVARVVDRK